MAQFGAIGGVLENNLFADFLINLAHFWQFAPKIVLGSSEFVKLQYVVMIRSLSLTIQVI